MEFAEAPADVQGLQREACRDASAVEGTKECALVRRVQIPCVDVSGRTNAVRRQASAEGESNCKEKRRRAYLRFRTVVFVAWSHGTIDGPRAHRIRGLHSTVPREPGIFAFPFALRLAYYFG